MGAHINERLSEMVTKTSSHSSMSEFAGNGYGHYYGNLRPNFLTDLWKSIDSVITLFECDGVYSYVPQSQQQSSRIFNGTGDADDDPMGFLLQSLSAPTEHETDIVCDDDDLVLINDDFNKTSLASLPEKESLSRFVSKETDTSTGNNSNENDSSTSNINKTTTNKSNKHKHNGSSSSSSNSNENSTLLWSFNYFFVNKSLKRILFFTCIETMRNAGQHQLVDDDYDNYDAAFDLYGEEEEEYAAKLHDQQSSNHFYYNESKNYDDDEVLADLDYNSDVVCVHDDYDLDPEESDVAGGIPVTIESSSFGILS